MKFIFVVLICLGVTLACENGCSKHGDCEANDKCVCYPGWGGSNCELRSCPYSDAFVDLLPGDLDHDGSVTTGSTDGHPVKNEWSPTSGINEDIGKVITLTSRAHRYAECSNAGKCDRNTGLCVCNSGFEGSACQRRSCPASSDGLVCSGHGMCLSSEAALIHKEAAPTSLPSGWEYEKFGVCVCDKGWSGISCGSRVCPKGINPNKGSYTYTFSVSGNGNTDLIDNNVNIKEHSYKMVYDGITYTTPTIPEKTGLCGTDGKLNSAGLEANEDIRIAITSIPPLSQSKVSIKCKTSGNGEIDSIDITTPYIELDLQLDQGKSSECKKVTGELGYCDINIAGSDKLYTSLKPSSFAAIPTGKTAISVDSIRMTATSMTIHPETGVNAIAGGDFISCSGRGNCDASTGLCQCFDGYTGLACDRTRN